MNDIQLDGDPRRLAMAIYRASLEAYKQEKGDPLDDREGFHARLEASIPDLAKQLVEALESEIRDVYLMNALEVMALDYARRDF